MKISDQGYLRPHQRARLSPKIDQLIAEVCPGSRVLQDSQEGEDHTLWGPLIAERTGYAADPALRHHASSGGALSAIARFLIECGTVDRVIQTTAAAEAPLENTTVSSNSSDDIYTAAGSRYAPSAPLSDFLGELEKPGRFALVGKPCDIAAVRLLARFDDRIKDKVPVMLSFFCAGIPSLVGARKILQELGVMEQDVVRFRYRGEGWPGRATAVLRDGREVSMSYSASWGNVLRRYVQFRCKICPDGSGGLADIVCADAWYSDENGYPLFDEEEGRSLIITRTVLGEQLVKAAMDNAAIVAEPVSKSDIALMQPSHVIRRRLIASRISAMAVLGNHVPRYKGFNLLRAALDAGLLANIKSFLGTVRRVVMKRW